MQLVYIFRFYFLSIFDFGLLCVNYLIALKTGGDWKICIFWSAKLIFLFPPAH